VLGLGSAAVDEVHRIGMIGGGQRAQADAKETKFCSVGLALQERACGGENLAGKLGRRCKRLRPGADAKVRGLELERDGGARQRLLLKPRRDFLGLRPQNALQRPEIRNVALEGRLGGHALGFAIGADFAGIDAAGKPRQPAAFLTIAPHHLDFADLLQVGDAPKAVASEPRGAYLADAEDEAHRFRREEGLCFARA
jgi:hypothetical protein